jgi:hypothetical protein
MGLNIVLRPKNTLHDYFIVCKIYQKTWGMFLHPYLVATTKARRQAGDLVLDGLIRLLGQIRKEPRKMTIKLKKLSRIYQGRWAAKARERETYAIRPRCKLCWKEKKPEPT